MKDRENRPDDAPRPPSDWEGGLRRNAERLASEEMSDATASEALSSREIREKLLELRVCQIELGLHKEALRAARYEVEETRKRSGDFYDLAPVGYCTISEEGLIVDANRTAASMLGTHRSALLNQPMARFIHEHDRAICRRHCQRLFHASADEARRGPEAERFDVRIMRSDGAVCRANISATKARPAGASPGGDGEGGGACCYLVLTDISERKRAEESLLERESFIRTVLDNLPIGIAVNSVEPGVTFEYMNDNFPKFYRTTREKLTGPEVFWDVVYEDPVFREELKNRVLADCASGNPERMEWNEIPIKREGRESAFINARNIPIPGKPLMISTVWDITEQKRAEQALRDSEAMLRMAERMARSGAWRVDLAEDRVIWSDEVAAIHDMPAGYSPSVEEGILFYAPESRGKIERVFRRCAVEGVPYDEEMEIVTANGRRVWVRTIGEVVRDASGKVTAVQGAFQDITEYKRVEQELRKSEEKHRSLIENLNEIVYVLNTKAEVEYVSPNIEQISGYSPSEVIGRLFLDFVHPEDLEGRIESFKASLAGENLVSEYRLLTKHGDIRWARTQARPIFDRGKPVGIQGLLLDITENKVMEEALRESEERFKTLFREAPVSILVHDKDTGEIVDANKTACSAYGLASVEELRKHGIRGGSPYSGEDAFALIKKAATEGPQSAEWMSRKVTGEAFWEQVNLRLVNLDGVPRVLAIAVDITKRKQAEAELRQYDWIMEANLASGDREEATDAEDYGDLTRLNTSRVILDALGKEGLASMAADVMALLDTSLAVYERNGDYAYAVFQSAWCRLLDTASFRLCGTDDVQEALECGKWICHENCWNGATRRAIESGKPVDIKCAGGINLYAVPVFAGNESVGAVSIGYGNPPKNDETLRKLASRLNVGFDGLRAKAWAYKPRPEFIIELGKRRCHYMARMIGETVERKRTTEDLRQAKDQFESLVTNIPGVIFRCAFDDGWTVLYMSEAAQPLTGRPASDFVNRPVRTYERLIHHEDAERRKAGIREAIAAGKAWDVEYRIRRRDENVRWVHERGRAMRGADGEAEFLDGLLLDITERKRAEASLARLGAAIEQAGEIIVITDPDGAIEYVNPAFTAATGYLREDVLGQNPRILKSGEQDDAFYREMWDTLAAGRAWEGRFVNKRKDGTFYTEEANISPVTDASGRLVNYVAVKRDISEHLQLSAQLQQAQKLESIGRLAGGIAHDFNNLLTGISGFAQLAFEAAPKTSDLRTDLREVLGLSERAADLTRQLLAFSRRQALDPVVFNLNDMLADLTKLLGRLIGENIEIRFYAAPDLGNVSADPSQIEQIIMNLAVNARDAMPDGGRLTIETANVELDKDYQETHAQVVPGPYVMLSVSDNGTGMDEETREHLFEPFFTTKRQGDGTGLGLPTVYGIVKQHGGNIWVYSEPDKGTTFKAYLPRVMEEAEAKASAFSEETPQGTETILIVEDEEAVGRVAARWLEGMGYRVLSAVSPAEADDILAEQGHEISLLLTDVVLPERNGRQLYESASREWPHLRVLYMSGYTDNAIVHHGVLDEGIPFIQKPFTAEALGRKVREALGGAGHDG